MEAQAFERERWLLRDQNILLWVSQEVSRRRIERTVKGYRERKREKERERERISTLHTSRLKYIGKIPLPNLTRRP